MLAVSWEENEVNTVKPNLGVDRSNFAKQGSWGHLRGWILPGVIPGVICQQGDERHKASVVGQAGKFFAVHSDVLAENDTRTQNTGEVIVATSKVP